MPVQLTENDLDLIERRYLDILKGDIESSTKELDNMYKLLRDNGRLFIAEKAVEPEENFEPEEFESMNDMIKKIRGE